MRRTLLESLTHRPLTEAPPAPDDAALAELAAKRRAGGAPPARPQPLDPRGRCRLMQRLRTGNPRAQQCFLRSRALRAALCRLAAPCRRAAGDRTGHQEHARGAGANLSRRRRTRNGWWRSATAHSTAEFLPAVTPSPAGCRSVVPVDLHIRGCPPPPVEILKGLIALLDSQTSKRPSRRPVPGVPHSIFSFG